MGCAGKRTAVRVADMDFETAPAVRKALQKRVEHGVFGYSVLPDCWYQAYQDWWKKRHHLEIEKDWLIFCTGVIPALFNCSTQADNAGGEDSDPDAGIQYFL